VSGYASPAEYKAGHLAIVRDWSTLDRFGTFLKFTATGK
jgi:hypothetical protein